MKNEGRKPGFNYMAIVGAAFILVIVLAVINGLRSQDSGTVGIGSVLVGQQVPKFAVPIATSQLDGDANIDPKEACAVHLKGAMRVCDYFNKPLVMYFWFTNFGNTECIDEQDNFNKVVASFGKKINAISIDVRDNRDDVRNLVQQHGWKVPVGYDADGAVSDIYRVGGCPTFIYVKKGGVMKDASIGKTTDQELTTRIRSLIHDSARSQDQKSETQKKG